MKRPLVLFTLALIAGIIVGYIMNSIFFVIAVILVIISIMIFIYNKYKKKLFILLIVLLFFCLGAFEILYLDRLNTAKLSNYEGEYVVIKGVVDSAPDIRDSKINYIIKVFEINLINNMEQKFDYKDSKKNTLIYDNEKSKNVKGRVILTTLVTPECEIYEYGREVTITGRLSTPKDKTNPHGFNYRRYLAQSGIFATIFARKENIESGKITNGNILIKDGLLVRDKIIKVINESLPEQQAGLLNGMLIGYKKGLSKNVQEVFSDCGLTHIMAVSGANVAFIVLPLIFIFKKLRINRKLSSIFIICILITFVFVTGFEPSVVRAVIMTITMLVGQLIRRDTDIYTSISFAAIIMLLYNPYNLFNIGFQLSFAATLSLIMFYKSINNIVSHRYIPQFISDILSATMAAQLGVLPITLFYFNKISIVSVLSNLIVAPVVELITILGSLMAVLGQISIVFSKIAGYANCTLLSFVLLTAKITSNMPFATIRVPTPPFYLILLYYIIICYFFWYRPRSNFKIRTECYVILFISLFMVISVKILIPNNLEVVFIDVGQGDSIFIRTYSGKTVLIDGGGSKIKSETNIGDTVVIPFLLDQGVTKLDMVVATHGHDDHIQGLIPVLRDFSVENIAIPDYIERKEFKQIIEIAESRKINFHALRKGDCIKMDDKTNIKILNPCKESINNESPLNNSSLVLKLIYRNVSILFTGDIEKEVEKMMVENDDAIEADVVKVAHHGSETSTSTEFVDRVGPRAAVISVGKNNFGHPSAQVLDEIKKREICLFRTDEDGAIILTSDGKKLRFEKVKY